MSYDISLYAKVFLERALASGQTDWTGADPIAEDAVHGALARVRAEGFVPDGPNEHVLATDTASARFHVHPGELTFAIENGRRALASIALCQQLAQRIAEDHGLAVWDPQVGASPGDEDAETAAWCETLRTAPSPELRVAAAQQLATGPAARVLGPLVDAAASDRSNDVRRAALESLGELGPAAAPAIARLLPLLGDASAPTVYWVTYALGRIGAAAESALPALESLTTRQEDGPRYGALDAIRRIRTAKG